MIIHDHPNYEMNINGRMYSLEMVWEKLMAWDEDIANPRCPRKSQRKPANG
jgi:hypothetical protein